MSKLIIASAIGRNKPYALLPELKKGNGRGGVRDFSVSAEGVPGVEMDGESLVSGRHSPGLSLSQIGLSTGAMPCPCPQWLLRAQVRDLRTRLELIQA